MVRKRVRDADREALSDAAESINPTKTTTQEDDESDEVYSIPCLICTHINMSSGCRHGQR